MTDNEKKLIAVQKKSEWWKTVNEFLPSLTALLLIVILTLNIVTTGNNLKVMTMENQQNLFQQGALETRKKRDSAQAKLLEGNQIQIQLLTQIIKNQVSQLSILSATKRDTVKLYIFKSKN